VQLLWRQAALIWQAKGYSNGSAADALEAHFGSNEGFSRSRISTLAALKCEPCPPEVADFILNELEVLNAKRWAKFQPEMTAALEAEAGPPITPRDLREVGKEAASSIADMMRGWLDAAGSTLQAFASKGGTLLSGMAAQLDSLGAKLDAQGAKLDRTRGKIDRVERRLDKQSAQLAVLQTTVNNTEAMTEVLVARTETREQQRRRDKRHLMMAIFGMGVLVIGAMGFMTWQSASRAAPSAPALCLMVNVGQGGADMAARTLPGGIPVLFDLQTFLGALMSGEMGKKAPVELYMPARPLPGQKLPPCESRLKEKEVNGGCWDKNAEGPPCEMLFRYGDGCYRPIAADPSKPVTLVPDAAGQEHHPAQH